MCGRFTLSKDGLWVMSQLRVPAGPRAEQWKPRYNIAPTQDVLALLATPEGPRLEVLKWGLIPSWAKDPKIGNRMINARVETVDSKPAFRRLLQARRCVVLADGFYEWKAIPGGKIPTHIRPPGQALIGFAGLWDLWKDPKGDEIKSCTILTTEARGPVKEVHERMPVILPREAWSAWIGVEKADPAKLMDLVRAAPVPGLEVVPVSKLVNSPRNDGPEILAPASVSPARRR